MIPSTETGFWRIDMPRLILIYASMGRAPGRKFVRSWQQEPLAMGVLAALTPAEWEVVFFDDRVEAIDYSLQADLVGISIETYSAKRGYQIAAKFRKNGVPVIFGGYHATLCPDEAIEHADSVCVGEAESLWQGILDDALHSRLAKRYKGVTVNPLKDIPVDRSLFAGKRYLKLSLIETGRGCPFKCNFCSINAFYKSTYRRRSIADIIKEVSAVENKYIFFVDDNFTGDIASARELFREVKQYRKRWMTQLSVAGLTDRDFVQEMAASGCIAVLIGFESLDGLNLNSMNKSVNRLDEFSRILSNLREVGIFVYGTFVFGYPHDTADLYGRTVAFAQEEKMFIAAFNHLVPFPGTALYRELEAAGKMRYDKWWLSDEYYFGEVPFKPETMTAKEVEERCLLARKQFYSIPSIMRRALDGKCNCGSARNILTYVQINHMLRKEVTEKRGVRLGFREGTNAT
ncbi:MAG: radical SAM protein [Desulforudis sp.]|jgi:radical SAM superfamily enzyme YgiQ (UPF0313 family)|nr:MAG: radical SAM protein [Desulforudis sp.]